MVLEGELIEAVKHFVGHPVTQFGGFGFGSGAIMFAVDKLMDILLKFKELRNKGGK
jgi:hypothetical protein